MDTFTFMKPNFNKTQILICGESITLNINSPRFSLFEEILAIPYKLSDDVKVLGVTLDERLDFKKMVSQTCKASYYSLHKLYNFRHYLDRNLKAMLVKTFVLSRQDYCNVFFCKLPQYEIFKLKTVSSLRINLYLTLQRY